MTSHVEFIEHAIRNEVQHRLNAIVKEEIATAQQNVAKRLRKEIDNIALGIMAEYDIRQNEKNVVITVKKLAPEV